MAVADGTRTSDPSPPPLSRGEVIGILAGVLMVGLALLFAGQGWDIGGHRHAPAVLLIVAGATSLGGAAYELLLLNHRARSMLFGFLVVQLIGIVLLVNEDTGGGFPIMRVSVAALTGLLVALPLVRVFNARERGPRGPAG